MSKKKSGMIGLGILGVVVLLAVVFSFVVSDSSEAKFIALSDGAMANLVGGIKKTQGWFHEGDGGDFADCSNPSNCDYTVHQYEPDWYGCEICGTGETEYYAFDIYLLIESWCEWESSENPCKYNSKGYDKTYDCQFPKSTTC